MYQNNLLVAGKTGGMGKLVGEVDGEYEGDFEGVWKQRDDSLYSELNSAHAQA